jgi:hypothetical protein
VRFWRFQHLAFLLSVLLCSGCVGIRTFPTIEPVTFKPSLIRPGQPILVDSLTPTFKWEQDDPHDKADFAIWTVVGGGRVTEMFFERFGISGSTYKLEQPLTPNGDYVWSVRISGTEQWATMNYTQGMVIPTPVAAFGEWSRSKGIPFRIKAPKISASTLSQQAPSILK